MCVLHFMITLETNPLTSRLQMRAVLSFPRSYHPCVCRDFHTSGVGLPVAVRFAVDLGHTHLRREIERRFPAFHAYPLPMDIVRNIDVSAGGGADDGYFTDYDTPAGFFQASRAMCHHRDQVTPAEGMLRHVLTHVHPEPSLPHFVMIFHNVLDRKDFCFLVYLHVPIVNEVTSVGRTCFSSPLRNQQPYP